MAVRLIYSDMALGAAEDAETTITSEESFSEPHLLPFGTPTGAVATMEHNSWGLSSDYKVKENQRFAFWSTEKSGDTCDFTTLPTITLEFSEQYTATGLTIRFSPLAGEYCTEIIVQWYQGEHTQGYGIYAPTEANFTIDKKVEAFDKIVIALSRTNLPNRRAKVEYIGIGVEREFDGKMLTDVKMVHETNLISDTVPINVLDASFHSDTDTDYVFQRKQPVSAYDNDNLIGVYYIENGERTGGETYSISCQDAIGVLDLDTYKGGLWIDYVPVEQILHDIVGGSFVLDISEEVRSMELRGHIPECTKREALQQVCFALGACVDTAGTNAIKVFLPATGRGTEIPPTETYTGGKVSTSDIVTEVEVTAYDIFEWEPGDGDDYIEFDGKQYKCSINVFNARNPNVTAGTLENKITIDGCYLISVDNAWQRANDILAYYMRRETYNAKHILSGQQLGDRSAVYLPWGDRVNANVSKMTITVSGIVASDTEFLLD